LAFAREVPIEVLYQGVQVGSYRLDMVIEERVLVEIKSTKAITEADERQIRTTSRRHE
jgi:GxxExxY protein